MDAFLQSTTGQRAIQTRIQNGCTPLKTSERSKKVYGQKPRKPEVIDSTLSVQESHVSGILGEIILFDGRLAVYKHSLDIIIYLVSGPAENELMLVSALHAFTDAVGMLLKNQVEKRAVLENLDLVLLCLDETIDDGCVCFYRDLSIIKSNHKYVQDHC